MRDVTAPLGEVASVFNGKTPAKSNQREEGHPVLKIKDVGEGGVFLGRFDSFVDADFAEKYKKKFIKKGDVLILNAAHNSEYVGSKLYKAGNEAQGALATGEWLVARSRSPKLLQSYLWCWFKNPYTRFLIKKRVKGIHLYPRDIAELQIPLPVLSEQRRITAILDRADRIVCKASLALSAAEKLPFSLFLKMFGDPLLNQRALKPATVEGLCQVITDCLHTTPNHFDEPSRFPSIRSSELQGGYIDLSSAKYVTEEEYKVRIQRHKPIPGDIIYCREGARFGNAGLVLEGMTPCLGQRTMLFQAKQGTATSEYLWAVICSKALYHQAELRVGGAAAPHVNIRDIRRFACVLPSYEEQLEFSRACKKTFALRERLSATLLTASQFQAALTQRAFRGEL